MCAYNKVNAIWCSENEHLLTEILREEWGYQGTVVSDWGAVQDTCRALMAGMDLQMPKIRISWKRSGRVWRKDTFHRNISTTLQNGFSGLCTWQIRQYGYRCI